MAEKNIIFYEYNGNVYTKQEILNMSDNIQKVNFNTRFKAQEELEEDLRRLIEKYDGQVSLAQFIGVLDVVKFGLLVGHSD